MASKHKQEDPWAGFVDVLSNILMVVVFLVIILGMAIFALSQQVTKVAVESAVQEERKASQSKQGTTSGSGVAEVSEAREAKADSPALATSNEKPGTSGRYNPDQAQRAREADEVAGNTNLSVRSAMLGPSKEIEVASEEIKPNNAPVTVTSAQAFLTLKFEKGAFRIDTTASREIEQFVSANKVNADTKVEIRAFAQSTVGSTSEARRIAYYRAMQTRSELIKSGYAPSRIDVKTRESASTEETDVVRIFAKP